MIAVIHDITEQRRLDDARLSSWRTYRTSCARR